MTKETYQVLLAGDPALRTKSEAVEKFTPEIAHQMDKMMQTMYEDNGIGLAANQVGILNRVLVMDVPEGIWEYTGADKNGALTIGSTYKSGDREEEKTGQPIAMMNPEIIWESEQRSVYDEGCLSLPRQYAVVERPAKVRIKFINRDGVEEEKEFAGLDSHCVQHEIDHLNGILFVDHLSRIKKTTILRKIEKLRKAQSVL